MDAEGEPTELFRADPQPGDAARHHPRPARCSASPSGRWPASRRPAPWSRSGPRPATCSPPPAGPASTGYTPRPYGRYAPGSTFKVVTSLALLRSGLDRRPRCDCPRRPWSSTASGSRTTTTTRPSALGRIPLSTAVANSCNTAFIGAARPARPARARRRGRLARPRRRPRPRVPGVLRAVPAPAEAGSETGHAAALIGQGKVHGLPAGDGAVAASVAKGARRRAPAAAGPRARSGRRRPGTAAHTRRRPVSSAT